MPNSIKPCSHQRKEVLAPEVQGYQTFHQDHLIRVRPQLRTRVVSLQLSWLLLVLGSTFGLYRVYMTIDLQSVFEQAKGRKYNLSDLLLLNLKTSYHPLITPAGSILSLPSHQPKPPISQITHNNLSPLRPHPL